VSENNLLVFEKFKDVKRNNISDELFNYFKDLIISGELEPGSALPTESELCDYIGVSRSTLREVLSAFVNMKLVVRTRRGTYVSDNPNLYNILPFPDILKKVKQKDFIDFRIMLESEIAAIAARYAGDEDVIRLQDTHNRMKENIEDIDILTQADTSFHLNLGICSHNELFSSVLEMITKELSDQIYEAFSNDISIRERAIIHHEKILNAIQEGNEKKAKKAMHDHITDVSNTIKKLLF
jgi:GntR family transcriptional repressor for pyruvate dehydrogenase complex